MEEHHKYSTQDSKICKSCNRRLLRSEFHFERRTKDGLRAVCKTCRNRNERLRRADNVEMERDRRRRRYRELHAERLGISFEAATSGTLREIRRAKRINSDSRNNLPAELAEDLRDGCSIRNRPDKPLSSFEYRQGFRPLDAEANRWLQEHDPEFGQGFYEAV